MMLKKVGSSLLKMIRSSLDWLVSSPRRAFLFIFILAFGIWVYSSLGHLFMYSLFFWLFSWVALLLE